MPPMRPARINGLAARSVTKLPSASGEVKMSSLHFEDECAESNSLQQDRNEDCLVGESH